MLQLPKFSQMTICTIKINSRDKSLFVTPWTKIMTSLSLFQNTFILRKPNIIKIGSIFIKTTLKDSKKLKQLETID